MLLMEEFTFEIGDPINNETVIKILNTLQEGLSNLTGA